VVEHPAGVVTISGSGSATANAQHDALLPGQGVADVRLQAGAAFTLPGPYSFTIQVTINESVANPEANAIATVQLNVPGVLFEASGSTSGVLPAGVRTVGASFIASALAQPQNNITSSGASGSFSFTLTLTPQ
jgi:hypothetical protein